jgi:hypothetical protein
VIKLEYDGLSGMKSELQGFRDLSAFRHFEIGVLYVRVVVCHCGERCIVLRSRKNKMGFAPKVKF